MRLREIIKAIRASLTKLAAERYARRGWSVIPVPHRSKNPGLDGWQRLRLTSETIRNHFNGQPQNIGVLLGEPSGWLIDIDLDHPRAVELAPQFLPPTPAIFGRAGKERSHWLYKATGPVATKKHKSKSAGMIVELRSTGAQTVFPPSTHESGEAVTWVDNAAEPASIDPDELLDCVKRLADAVLVELGERRAKAAKKERARSTWQRRARRPAPTNLRTKRPDAWRLCCGSPLTDHRDGSHRLFVCACRAVEHDLDDAAALAMIGQYARQRPFSRGWSDAEILQRLRDAEKQCRRGAALELDADSCVPLGQRDPQTGKLVLSPRRTLPTADAYVRDFHLHPDGRTLHSYAGMLMAWQHNRYAEIEDNGVKKQLQSWLHDSLRYLFNRQIGELELVPYDSNPSTVNAALESIRAFAHLPVTVTSPSWLDEGEDRPPASEICLVDQRWCICLRCGNFRRRRCSSPSAPRLRPRSAGAEPMAWHQFLHQLFDGDLEALELLQEWFGYCLTGDTSQQKMMLIVGPRRSGKGTIARVLARLVGIGNVCGPTTSSLASHFGLQPLIGKTLAIVSDARFHGENIPTVVERLLCISGEDLATVDRKFLGSVTMKLPTRFMFLTNELPRLTDASGALAGRFVTLRLTESFYGKEDTGLTDRLLDELPGILNWAIEGWQRLHQRGHFLIPTSVKDVVQEIEDLSSPVSAFVRDECIVGPGHRVLVDVLYDVWRRWCEQEGRQIVTTKQTFGRDLAAAVAGVTRRRGTAMQPFYEGISLR